MISTAKPKRGKCWLKTRHKQCCCNCVWNWQTAPGPSTHDMTGKAKCSCYEPNGWACVHPEIRLVMPNTKHCIGCECYTPREKASK